MQFFFAQKRFSFDGNNINRHFNNAESNCVVEMTKKEAKKRQKKGKKRQEKVQKMKVEKYEVRTQHSSKHSVALTTRILS